MLELGTLSAGRVTLLVLFGVTQALYLIAMVVWLYFFSLPKNIIGITPDDLAVAHHPKVLLLYPVLRERLEAMRTTFVALDQLSYPKDRYRIVAIPNADDAETIASIHELQKEFPWLDLLAVPPTSDASWSVVWGSWDANDKAYWWHSGREAGIRDLPPKKTRQLIYAFYTLCHQDADEETLVSYIDADSAPSPNYFLEGAAGIQDYDVVQLTNVAGNLLDSWATSFHASDHMLWDATLYAHMSSDGRQPYFVLGKGLFYKASDLHELGGFHPWLTIEDPEIGLRLWANGRRLGVVQTP